MNENLEMEVRKMVPEDGDVVVLKCKGRISMEQQRVLGDAMKALGQMLMKRIQFLILDDGMEVEILKTSQLRDAANDNGEQRRAAA